MQRKLRFAQTLSGALGGALGVWFVESHRSRARICGKRQRNVLT